MQSEPSGSPSRFHQFPLEGSLCMPGSKRNHCGAVQRALRGAEQQGIIDRSPISHLQKPRAGRRKTVINDEEYARILAYAPNQDFRDLIQFAWHTAARTAEILAIEKRHLDLDRSRIVFPVSEEKMQRIPRIVYLSEKAMTIVRRRCVRFSNFLFTNAVDTDRCPRGLPALGNWDGFAGETANVMGHGSHGIDWPQWPRFAKG